MKSKNAFLTALAILGLSTASLAQVVPSYVPSNGLLGWWPFNNNANDESGNGYHGTNHGASITLDRFGNANAAYAFNGVSSYINIPYNPNLTPTNYSVSAWVKTAIVPNQQKVIFAQGMGRPQVAITNAGKAVTSWFSTSGAFPYITSSGTITNNVWRHVVAISTGAMLYIYVDSVLQSSISTSSYSYSNCSNFDLQIGGFNTPSTACGNNPPGIDMILNGDIDDIGLWNRALSQQEIADLFNGPVCTLSITTQPANQSASVGGTARFIAAASDPNATYQWNFNPISNGCVYDGINNDTLTVSNIGSSNDNQEFQCYISMGEVNCNDTTVTALLTVTNSTGIESALTNTSFSIFPNPAVNELAIATGRELLGKHYSLCDIQGRIVKEGSILNEKTTVDLHRVECGMYFIRIGETYKKAFQVVAH